MIQVDGIFVQQSGGGNLNEYIINAEFSIQNITNYDIGVLLRYYTISDESGSYDTLYTEDVYYFMDGEDKQFSIPNVFAGLFIVTAENLSTGDNIYIRGDEYGAYPVADDESIGSIKTVPFFISEPGSIIQISTQ